MAKTLASSMNFSTGKLSDFFGVMIFQGYRETENPNTHVKTKKVTVYARQMKDMYDITLPVEVDLEGLKDDDVIDFANAEITVRASGRKSFNDVSAYLTTSITAEGVIVDKVAKSSGDKAKA